MISPGRHIKIASTNEASVQTYNFGADIQPMYMATTGNVRDTARGFIKQARAVPGSMKYSAAQFS